MKKGTKTERKILFAYLTPKSYSHLKELAHKHKQSLSYVVEELVSSHREKSVFKLETKIPIFVKKAKEWSSQQRRA